MGLFSKITRSITKPLKKVIKSPFGKAALLGLGAYYGGQAGMFGKGIQEQGWRKFMGSKLPGWAYTAGTEATQIPNTPLMTHATKPSGIIGNLANKWSGMSGLGKAATIGGATALTAGIAAPELEEEINIDVDDPTGHANYLKNRGLYEDEWAEWLVSSGKAGTKEEALVMVRDNPMFSHGGRVKANIGLYAGPQGGMNQGMNSMTMNQGLGGMNVMGMGSPRSQMMGQQQDPRMAKMNQMQNINRGIQSVKPPQQSEDAELIQLIKMLTSMGIPMEQLRGRTKEELVELVVSVKGKMEGGRDVKETAEVIEEEDIREQNQAAGGGLMRTGYANGADVEGTAASEDAPFHQQRVLQEDLDQSGGVNSIFGGPSELEEAEYKSGLLDDKYKRSEIRLSLAKQIRKENPDWSTGEVWDEIRRITKKEHPTLFRNYAQGGLTRTGYAMGSSQFGLMGNEHPVIPSKDGQQLDMRDRGGYQPHGKAEKHDDVRALLAQGEFVMTSDAVKGMGGGDRELGAKKMYDLMHNMEAMA